MATNSLFQKVVNIFLPQITFVRFRYHAEKIAKGPIMNRHGYKEKLFQGGLLPRIKDAKKLPIPDYRPRDVWSEKRALFGQNDYIDILGNETLHPTRVSYNVPIWLRGVKGNEYQLLIRKKKLFKAGIIPHACPSKWYNMNKRIRFLHKFLNTKTRTRLMKE